jgi:hypothetical protein
MRSLLFVSVLGFAGACVSTTATYMERSDTTRPADLTTCAETSCGGSGDALTIGLGVAVLVGVAVARFWQD